MAVAENLYPAFRHNSYLFRRKVFTLFGASFHVYDESGNVVFFSRQKPFKLKEDFRVYSDESQSQELLTIKTPQILDLGATYYIKDSATQQAVGALRRQWAKSLIKDEWTFLSQDGKEIGKLTEESWVSAIASRLIKLIPQNYVVIAQDGKKIAEIKRYFNPFVLKYTMNIFEPEPAIDRRLLMAAGILLAGIERRER